MDLCRAYVHMLTSGKDGASPHAVADVISALRKAGHKDLSLKSYSTAPFSFVVSLGGQVVTVRAAEAPEEGASASGWLHVTCGNKFVRVNAGQTLQVPCGTVGESAFYIPVAMMPPHGLWVSHWPRKQDWEGSQTPAESIDKYARRVFGSAGVPSFRPTHDTTLGYFSETAVADAIRLVAQGACSV